MNKRLTMLAMGCSLLLLSCEKNSTRYFTDPNSKEQAIFSNTGNNLMTCFIQGKPWRTTDRTSGGVFTPVDVSEMYINYLNTTTANDTLILEWQGYYTSDTLATITSSVFVKLPVPNGFTKQQFAQFKGQRLSLDGSNGYGMVYAPGINEPYCKVNIYFHDAGLLRTANARDSGMLSGLLTMSAPSFSLTNGRFDHLLLSNQVQW
jgi:hypothetical protein